MPPDRSPRPPDTSRVDTPRSLAILVIAFAAPFLGGATRPWSEGVVLILLGLLAIIWPPKTFGSRGFACALAGVFLSAAGAFLPAKWFGIPAWRGTLETDLAISLSPTLSPQPWLTGNALLLLLAGLTWIYWLSLQTWNSASRRFLVRGLVLVIALLATLSLALYAAKVTLPFWLSTERGFGPFPNRNQTANLFAISGILAVACAYEDGRSHKLLGLAWLLPMSAIVFALFAGYSRAALLVFMGGLCFWMISVSVARRSGKMAAIALAAVFLVLAAFFFGGGDLLTRFRVEGAEIGLRGVIHKETLGLIASSPWLGIG